MTKTPQSSIRAYSDENARLKKLLEESVIYYQCIDAQGLIMDVNSAWLNALSYIKEDVVGKPFIDFLDEESIENFTRHIKRKNTKKIRGTELILRCKDQSKMFVEFSCISSKEIRKKDALIHCVFKNVTKLRQVEKALVVNEQRYTRLVELANVGIYEFDPYEEKFTYLNDVIKKTFESNGFGQKGLQLKQFMDENGRKQFGQRINDLINGKDIPKRTEYKLYKPNGEEIWVQISNSYIKDEHEKVKVIGVAQEITERKKLEMELQASNDRLEQINNNLPSIVFQYTYMEGKTDFIHVSQNIRDLTGYSSEQIILKPEILLSLIDPDDYKNLVRDVEATIKEDKPVTLLNKVIDKNQKLHWIRTTVARRFIDTGKALYTGIIQDVTEEVTFKNKLERAEKKYEALVNSAAIGISTMSKSGIVLTVNPRLCEICGYSEDELVGKNFTQIPAFYPWDIGKYIKLYKLALKDELSTEPVKFDWKHKSGEHRWGEGHLSAIKENGKTIAYQAVLVDVTNRVMFENREKERKKELNFLFESACDLLNIESENGLYEFLAGRVHQLLPDAVVVINSLREDFKKLTVEIVKFPDTDKYWKVKRLLGNMVEGRTFETNEEIFKYALRGRLETHNQTIYDLTLHQISENVCKQVERLINLKSIYEISLSFQKDIIGGAAILIPHGSELQSKETIELLFREASEALIRIKSRTKLVEAIERKTRLYSILSHDLLSPFNSQMGFIQLLNLRYDLLSDQKRKEYLKNIESSSLRIYELLQSILHWTKSDLGPNQRGTKQIFLNHIVRKTLDLYKDSIALKGIRTKALVDPDIMMFAEYNAVFTVLRNLVSNAVKFSKEGGIIEIVARQEKEEVFCSVKDYGIGMKPEILDNLLNKNNGANTEGYNGEPGHGLGLMFTRELIENNRGHMDIKSQEGRGTEVSFTLPSRLT